MTNTTTHTIEMQSTAVMVEFNAGMMTRGEVEQRITAWRKFDSICSGSRWGQAATKLEQAMESRPSSSK